MEDLAPHGWRHAPPARSQCARCRICLVSRGSRGGGLLRLALRAQQWRGYHGASRRRAAAAAMMWSRIGRRLRLAVKRAHQHPGPTSQPHPAQPVNPGRHRLLVDRPATPPWSPVHPAQGLANHHDRRWTSRPVPVGSILISSLSCPRHLRRPLQHLATPPAEQLRGAHPGSDVWCRH